MNLPRDRFNVHRPDRAIWFYVNAGLAVWLLVATAQACTPTQRARARTATATIAARCLAPSLVSSVLAALAHVLTAGANVSDPAGWRAFGIDAARRYGVDAVDCAVEQAIAAAQPQPTAVAAAPVVLEPSPRTIGFLAPAAGRIVDRDGAGASSAPVTSGAAAVGTVSAARAVDTPAVVTCRWLAANRAAWAGGGTVPDAEEGGVAVPVPVEHGR